MRTSFGASIGVGALALGLLLGGCAAGPVAATAQRTDPVPFLTGEDFIRTENGLRITGTSRISDRSYRVFLASEAVSADAFAEGNSIVVTLPEDFDASMRYPVLYLLNGSGPDGDATQWFKRGKVETVLGAGQVIAVMPDGGNAGWYSNWKSDPEGSRRWQKLHLDELVPWVDAHLPTLATSRGRAIGGVSMGGFGAIRYAAARPDLFAEAFSISGILDFGKQTTRELIDQQVRAAGGSPGAVFGPPGSPTGNPWAADDPMLLADRLSGVEIHLAAGKGVAADPTDPSDPQQLEYLVRESTERFASELDRQGIEHDFTLLDNTTPGCDGGHNWGCWTPEAQQLVPRIISGLAAREESAS